MKSWASGLLVVYKVTPPEISHKEVSAYRHITWVTKRGGRRAVKHKNALLSVTGRNASNRF